MSSKKNVQLLIFALINVSVCMAQAGGGSKFYIKAYGGYGILTPGSYKGNSPSSDYSNFATGNLGAGAGAHFGGGLGYVINDFLNAGIDAEYINGNVHSSASAAGPYTNSVFSQKINYAVTTIIPNVTFKALSKPDYYIYTRVGIIIATTIKIGFINSDSSYSPGSGTVIQRNGDEKYSFNINLGIQTAIGAQFKITGKLKGFAELVGNILPSSPVSSRQKYVESSHGPTFSPYSTTNNYNYTYKNSGSYSNTSTLNSTGGEDINGNQPSITQNINYIGINIGLVLKL